MSAPGQLHASAGSIAGSPAHEVPRRPEGAGRGARAERASSQPGRARSQLGPADFLMLVAVGALVLLVSLSRLDAYARGTNERDALGAMQLFATAVFESEGEGDGVSGPVGVRRGALSLGEVLSRDRGLAHRLGDARLLEDGTRVLHHGYCFSLSGRESRTLLAWPRRPGRTGAAVYWYRPGVGLFVLAAPRHGAALDPSSLEGVTPDADGGWRRIE